MLVDALALALVPPAKLPLLPLRALLPPPNPPPLEDRLRDLDPPNELPRDLPPEPKDRPPEDRDPPDDRPPRELLPDIPPFLAIFGMVAMFGDCLMDPTRRGAG